MNNRASKYFKLRRVYFTSWMALNLALVISISISHGQDPYFSSNYTLYVKSLCVPVYITLKKDVTN